MAKTNKDAAFGLRAIGKVGQNRDNQGLGEYVYHLVILLKIFFQDAVSATAAGTIHQAAASEAFFLDHSMVSFTLIQQLVSLRLLITMKVQFPLVISKLS